MSSIVISARIVISVEDTYDFVDPGVVTSVFATAWGVDRHIARAEFYDRASAQFVFAYSTQTNICELKEAVCRALKINSTLFASSTYGRLAILAAGLLYLIEDENGIFISLCSDLVHDAELQVWLIICGDAGEVFRDQDPGLHYYFHSREPVHHEPHVHVHYRHDYEASMSLLGEPRILSGNLPTKAENMAKQRIVNNREELLKLWNSRTDGRRVDVDYALGLTPIRRP